MRRYECWNMPASSFFIRGLSEDTQGLQPGNRPPEYIGYRCIQQHCCYQSTRCQMINQFNHDVLTLTTFTIEGTYVGNYCIA